MRSRGDLYTTPGRPYDTEKQPEVSVRGTVLDLLIPIISLIICCMIGMLYTGGFFSGEDFVTAFSQSDASLGLTMGSFFGLLITIGLYQVRRVLKFSECMACIPEGFKSMVPAINDPVLRVDTEGDDGQPRRRCLCGDCGCVQRPFLLKFPSGDHLRCGLLPGFRDGNILGNLRDPDPDRCCCV